MNTLASCPMHPGGWLEAGINVGQKVMKALIALANLEASS